MARNQLERDQTFELAKLTKAYASAAFDRGRATGPAIAQAQLEQHHAYAAVMDYIQELGDGSGFFRAGI
jgi:hypothetical protein